MEIISKKTVAETIEMWDNQQNKSESQMSFCCYCGD